MANKYDNLNDLFTDMADAIRTKTETTERINAYDFPSVLENLKSGFDYVNQEVAVVPDYAFYGCEDLLNVDCCNLISIGTSAFENCSKLKTVTLYEGVTDVEENTFKGCDCIIYCKFTGVPDGWHENWNPDDCMVVFGEPIETWDISASSKDNVVVQLYSGVDDKYVLLVSGKGDMKNFDSNNDIPWISYRENIKIITIQNGITSIGKTAFYRCSSLTSITIPDSVVSINNSAFADCTSLTEINISDGVTIIDYNAFHNCKSLTSITIPDSVVSINNSAFANCTSLTSITLPDSVTDMGSNVFSNTAYYNDASNWENDLLYICNYLIKAKSSLSGECVIKDGITHIGGATFYGCSSLTSVTIPYSVTSIGVSVFYNCSSLTSVTFTGTIAQWRAITKYNAWNYNTGNYTIYCADGTISKGGTITYK